MLRAIHLFLLNLRVALAALFFDVVPNIFNEHQWKSKKRLTESDLAVDLAGKVAIITGGTRGIGFDVVKMFLSKGCHVITGSTASIDEIEKRQKDLLAIVSNRPSVAKLEIWPLDLSSMSSVQKFIDRFKERELHLNYLICNAGIFFIPYTKTVDGFEKQFAVNYLSHSLMIYQLFPLLLETGKNSGDSSQIVNVSSSAHAYGFLRFESLGERTNERLPS